MLARRLALLAFLPTLACSPDNSRTAARLPDRPTSYADSTALGPISPTRAAGRRFDPPKTYFDSIVVEQTSGAQIDYSDAYEKALRKDAPGLAIVLQASLHTDGAGAETHGRILWDLLGSWGDTAFAGVLSAQSQEVRTRVRCFLDYQGDSSWALHFARTAALAPLNPNCRSD